MKGMAARQPAQPHPRPLHYAVLPDRLALGYARLEPFGFPILLLLIFLPPHVLGVIMMPMVQASIDLIGAIFRL